MTSKFLQTVGHLGVVVAGDRKHVADSALLQSGPQYRVLAVGLVAGDEPDPHSTIERSFDHLQRLVSLCRKLQAIGHPGRGAPIRIADPGLRRVQPAVDQCPPARRRVRQEHADLGVLDPPGAICPRASVSVTRLPLMSLPQG